MNRVNIGSDNGLSPIRRQAIISTNAGLLSIGPLGTNFSEIRIQIQKISFMKMPLNVSSAKWRPFGPGGDELTLVRQANTTDYLWTPKPPKQSWQIFYTYIYGGYTSNLRIKLNY